MSRTPTFRQELVDNDIVLSVRHLKQFFKFGHGKSAFKTKAVHDVSFDIKKGECFGLVGESGCGKTTTGRSLIRLYQITSGSIYFLGHRISAGIRWNEKEIKWKRIKFKEEVKALKIECEKEVEKVQFDSKNTAKLKDIEILINEEEAKIVKYESEYRDAIRTTTNIDDEAENASAKDAAKSTFDSKVKAAKEKIEEYRKEINSIQEKTNEEIRKIKSDYDAKIHEKKENIAEIVSTQKETIKQCKYDNKHVDKKIMSKMQMIFQDPVDSLDPRMTVEDIIQEGLHIQGQYNRFANSEKVKEVLIKVGLLPEYASRYPHEFSGGQRQRIGIARALIMNPEFLICDEPISALDVSIRAQIINLLNELKEDMNLTILFIAHDLSVVKYFCDRIAVMYYGQIVELATSEELFKHPLHPYTNALLSAIPKPDPISEKVRQRIIYNPNKDHDYSTQGPSLREIVPGHWVLANDEEIEKYLKQIKKNK